MSVVARAGTRGVAAFRIPAVAVAPDGVILLAYDARVQGPADPPGQEMYIVVKRSVDGGKRFSTARRVTPDIRGEAYTDPSFVVDTANKTVFLFYTYAPPGVGFFNSAVGMKASNNLQPQYISSNNAGLTWSHPMNLFSSVKHKDWRGTFFSSGDGIQIHSGKYSGRLIQPLVHMSVSGNIFASDIWSADNGVRWHDGDNLGINTDESKVVELSNGVLLQNARSSNPHIHSRVVGLSRNGGATFINVHALKTLPDPHVNAAIIRVAATGGSRGDESSWLLFSNPASRRTRRRLSIRLSKDNGRTWSRGCVVDPGRAMYSSMAFLGRGVFGLVWEDGSGDLLWTRFTLAELDKCLSTR